MVVHPPVIDSQTASISAVEVTPTPTPIPTPEPTPQPTTAPLIAYSGDIRQLLIDKTVARFGVSENDSMLELVGRESELDPYAINPSSGACGIPQAYPCSKLLAVIGSLDNVPGQIDWMLGYIADRYTTPSRAVIWHDEKGWY